MILASYIRPFDAKQKIYVLNGKHETEEIRLCDLEHFSDEIMQLINEYNVSELELHGNTEICEQTKKLVSIAEKTKYNKSNLKITLKGV